MMWGDLELRRDTDGQEYIQYSERAAKTRTGGDGATRAYNPRMYACVTIGASAYRCT